MNQYVETVMGHQTVILPKAEDHNQKLQNRRIMDHLNKLLLNAKTPELRKTDWTSDDGRIKAIKDMHQHHLINSIRKIEDGGLDGADKGMTDLDLFDYYLLLRLERINRGLTDSALKAEGDFKEGYSSYET